MLKTIINYRLIKIILICLILVLSILDAPEYINCVHIGLCEFLEIKGLLSSDLESDSMKDNHSRLARNNFFIILEDITISNKLAKNHIIYYLPLILSSLEFLSSLRQNKNLYLQKTVSSLIVANNTISKSLELIDISVIRS